MAGWLAEQLDAIYPDRLFAPVFIPTVFDQAMPCDGPNQRDDDDDADEGEKNELDRKCVEWSGWWWSSRRRRRRGSDRDCPDAQQNN